MAEKAQKTKIKHQKGLKKSVTAKKDNKGDKSVKSEKERRKDAKKAAKHG